MRAILSLQTFFRRHGWYLILITLLHIDSITVALVLHIKVAHHSIPYQSSTGVGPCIRSSGHRASVVPLEPSQNAVRGFLAYLPSDFDGLCHPISI